MTGRPPRLFTIPPGVPFLPALAEAILAGRLIDGFPASGDPLALTDSTVYVPTRRAARALRAVFANRPGAGTAILPTIRPLGEFEEDLGWFADAETGGNPPVDPLERRLLLAPLVRKWKERLPTHLAARYEEGVVVPATMADALWLADDLAGLIDAIATGGVGTEALGAIAAGRMSAWWEVILDFLKIITVAWPKHLAERGLADPTSWRDAALRAEARRLRDRPPGGPVIAAGSTGSIPATAELLAAIAGLGNGAVVLPGYDTTLDAASQAILGAGSDDPTVYGHPQFGMAKLLRIMGAGPRDVVTLAEALPELDSRARLISAALRPAAETQDWPGIRHRLGNPAIEAGLDAVTLVEAGNERDEALAVAVALREALETPGTTAALVTPDRALARRVSADLLRFGIRSDDSGGTPLMATPPGTLMSLLLRAAFRPGDPVPVVALLKHPLLRAGMARGAARAAAERLELVALRGGTGRPDIAALDRETNARLEALDTAQWPPFWKPRLDGDDIDRLRHLADRVARAAGRLASWRGKASMSLRALVSDLTATLESLCVDDEGSLADLYGGDAGEALAAFLRSLLGAESDLDFDPAEAPEVIGALANAIVVKPRATGSARVFIWGALEARLQSVDTLVIGGLNEGTWPRQPDPGRFLSRLMADELGLDPPERQIGQSAHDFIMAAGARRLVLTRSARSGDAPAVASRWIERLAAFAGGDALAAPRRRGERLLRLADALDRAERVSFALRPQPAPPLALRPKRLSVTEVETLRRDPYAVYARRVLGLERLDDLVRDPGAAERGQLMHDALAAFVRSGTDPAAGNALDVLLAAGRGVFDAAALPADVEAVWWPRFVRTASGYLDWERGRASSIARRFAEIRALPTPIGATGITLSGRADRIDIRSDGLAEIIDFKTGSLPSKAQAHTLIAPQLALEAALLARGAFERVDSATPCDLVYVRLRPDGTAKPESILDIGRGTTSSAKTAVELGEESWRRLQELLEWFADERHGYRSRVLPFREGDVEGDYDHLARVLEWSAGGDGPDGEDAP